MARLPNQKMKPGLPAKPLTLSKAAAVAWDSIMADLVESNIAIAKAHGRLIETAANIVADMADAQETVRIEGAYCLNSKNGVSQMHPAARRLDSLRRDYVKVLSLLGLRSAVSDGGGNKNGESLADILGG